MFCCNCFGIIRQGGNGKRKNGRPAGSQRNIAREIHELILRRSGGWYSLALVYLFLILRGFDFIPEGWQAIGGALLLISVVLFVISAIRRSW